MGFNITSSFQTSYSKTVGPQFPNEIGTFLQYLVKSYRNFITVGQSRHQLSHKKKQKNTHNHDDDRAIAIYNCSCIKNIIKWILTDYYMHHLIFKKIDKVITKHYTRTQLFSQNTQSRTTSEISLCHQGFNWVFWEMSSSEVWEQIIDKFTIWDSKLGL